VSQRDSPYVQEVECVADGSVKPTECHPVPVFERVTRDNCRSKYHVDLRQCQGSCGDEIGDCCVPDKNSTISVVTNCKEDGVFKTIEVC